MFKWSCVLLKARSSWQVTWSVWQAMFIREFVARTMADRMAWFWMLIEPILFVMIMVVIRVVILGRMRMVINAEFIPWLIVGLLGFFLFRENMTRSVSAISISRALFAFRQVKPIDTVFVRCFLEGMLKTVILFIFILGATLLDIWLVPDLPLEAMFAWVSLWCLGLGIGLCVSVLAALVKEIGIIVRFMTLPLLILSGVILPVTMLPHYLQPYILLNPIVHGLESLRLAFFQNYWTLPEISLLYLWYWTFASLLLGLMLHKRFEMRLKAK